MNEMTKGLFLNGKWVARDRTYPLHAPYDGKQLATISMADTDDVKRAIEGAYQAYQTMRQMPAHQRAEILYRLADLLQERKEQLARIVAEEAGKPIRTARAEVARTIVTYRFAAEEAKRIYGETIPMDAAPGGEHRLGMTWREPLGVVVAITPFNFPLNLVAHKLGPAFAAGNTVVLKPAEQTPLSALQIAELFQQAGLPDGALQVLTGSGRELSDALITDQRVKKVTFTGSAAVGKLIKAKAGLRKVTLELGSNSALIVEPDVSLDQIIPRCVEGAFTYAGQVCISLQRIYVHESIYEPFSSAFIEQTRRLQVGDPLLETTDISAVIHEREAERIQSWIDQAVQAGASLGCGGTSEGSRVTPTVLLDVTPDMAVSCEEAFAPIVSIVPYKDLPEAINLVNDSVYGLNVGIYSRDIDRALYAARQLEAGGVIVNDIPTFRVDHMPYGGVKESGYGREGVKYAMQEMTEVKFVSIKTSL
ncbi:aldehyde dehydrogenase family protein [Brevibacillus humidisoli]|uniref:aldehyde dehydrogenase family protein n=1 Tax=Brevibacillus humidisoli TaxID=2895522 RepID=UPI001E55D92F|nr:aldehyde dehydrogenase family protein [Brevibacillus humidisoli]UFJ40997.1 aldehyde dehydrogenase family protein [Brevibacillus humidisoli]